jgi:hypothetical protein
MHYPSVRLVQSPTQPFAGTSVERLGGRCGHSHGPYGGNAVGCGRGTRQISRPSVGGQGLQRVHPRRGARGQVAGEQRHEQEEDDHREEDPRFDGTDVADQGG